jgi:hypothetical protein
MRQLPWCASWIEIQCRESEQGSSVRAEKTSAPDTLCYVQPRIRKTTNNNEAGTPSNHNRM